MKRIQNPFQDRDSQAKEDKESMRDPLDMRDFLIDSTRKVVVTEDGGLKPLESAPKDKPRVELTKERYWGTESSHKALLHGRISLEKRAMQLQFPSFEIRQAQSKVAKHGWLVASVGQFFWVGVLRTYSGASYSVAIVYPPDYPFGEIWAYVLEPYLPASEHRFQDGHLCLYEHGGRGQGYEEGRSTAVTVTAWTSAWLHAYEIWRTDGSWPVLGEKE